MKCLIQGIFVFIVLSTMVALSGCETFKGTGRDISNFGKLISGD